jgi:hypothetical protein
VYYCNISGVYTDVTDGNKRKNITSSTVLPKGCFVYFNAMDTNVPKPYDVYWQVVNNGEEATRDNCLRGGIFKAQTLGRGGLIYKDLTAFSGLHWVECFIVKNGVCVARSSEFFVNIR